MTLWTSMFLCWLCVLPVVTSEAQPRLVRDPARPEDVRTDDLTVPDLLTTLPVVAPQPGDVCVVTPTRTCERLHPDCTPANLLRLLQVLAEPPVGEWPAHSVAQLDLRSKAQQLRDQAQWEERREAADRQQQHVRTEAQAVLQRCQQP